MEVINKFKDRESFLSNFYYCNQVVRNKLYKTNEHWYQAMKSVSDVDHELIRNSTTPYDAKVLGNKVTLRNDWNSVMNLVMIEGLRIKFSNKLLRSELLATGTALLVEGNYHHDNYWGDCFCYKCKYVKGLNYLGKLLMTVRNEISCNITIPDMSYVVSINY